MLLQYSNFTKCLARKFGKFDRQEIEWVTLGVTIGMPTYRTPAELARSVARIRKKPPGATPGLQPGDAPGLAALLCNGLRAALS